MSRANGQVNPNTIAIVDHRDRLACRLTGRGIGAGRNLHHRQLRSQGPRHTAGNLVTLSGSGTTGTHGSVHADPARSIQYGFIVPSWVHDPQTVPIHLASIHDGSRSWALLLDDASVIPLTDATAAATMRALGVWTT